MITKEKIGELRQLRKAAMPGPVRANTLTGYYGARGVMQGPTIRCLGDKRAQNQAFLVAAFNTWDELLDEINRLKAKCGEMA